MARDWGRNYLQPTFHITLSIITALLHWKAIRTKSPQEYVVDAWWTSTLDPLGRTQKITTKYYRPLFYPPAHRCVRVKLSSGDVSRMMDDICLFSDFYLDDAGNLNLELVRQRWSLEAIQVVVYSPEKGLNLFIPHNMDSMPARHVDLLKGHDGCIRIIGILYKLTAYSSMTKLCTEVPSQSAVKIRNHRARLRWLSEYAALAWKLLFIILALLIFTWFVYAWLYEEWFPKSLYRLQNLYSVSRFLNTLECAGTWTSLSV
ncbi:hypothetical protein BDY19DRAFT_743796 [Irpex rosettiformis]|uniref:Uncharacterized protein n=1 Tax=Irpex rosettiformis TaxID=378272 RepID=A0ACB8U9H8_9APHY|nr:hypothetical protein BDY19DRAFT_743796 [Irpex rosettiformis]